MGKNKPDGKAKGKGSQLVIRIDKAERAAFVSLCEELDTSAAREIRRFMRGFVRAHTQKRTEAADEAPEAGSLAVEPTPRTLDSETAPTEPAAGSPQNG
jgi:hypothetical protein